MKDLFGRGEILVIAALLGALTSFPNLTESLMKQVFRCERFVFPFSRATGEFWTALIPSC